MHVHAEGRCRVQVLARDRVDSAENFGYNCTPRMTRGASDHLEHFDNAGFGDLYNAGQPRYIQFGVKLYF
jgi:hypothetical protein